MDFNWWIQYFESFCARKLMGEKIKLLTKFYLFNLFCDFSQEL